MKKGTPRTYRLGVLVSLYSVGLVQSRAAEGVAALYLFL